MKITGYIAMTSAEFSAAPVLPAHPAWMACHFSCYATGLTNMPHALPPGSMIIVNDRTPVQGHDPELIAEQLQYLWETQKPDCFLLDLQRPGSPEAGQIVKKLLSTLSCPVGVSDLYAEEFDCPVFLCAPPVDRTLEDHIRHWEGREIWLEIAPDAALATILTSGCQFSPASLRPLQEPVFYDNTVHCHYHTDIRDQAACIHLLRDKEALRRMIRTTELSQVTRAVGLYQQLGNDFFSK